MKTVETKFLLSYTDEQYEAARLYIDDMKRHRNRVFWIGKEDKSDEELIISQIAHRILSGFYNNYDPSYASKQIKSMSNRKDGLNS
ncbi:MAG: hypothetical protein AAFX87_04180 [Bacteroidota bacterium]